MKTPSSRYGISLVLILLALAFGLVFWERHSGDPAETAFLNHFQAIKDQKFTESYFTYTSKDFQKNTSLEEFKNFLKSNPQIGEDSTVQIEEKQTRDDQRSILVRISRPNTEPLYFSINLEKEGDDWKIASWHQSSPEEKKQLAVLERALDLIRTEQPKEAYQSVTGPEFRKITSEEGFQDYLANYPILGAFTGLELLDVTTEQNHPVVYIKLQNDLQEAIIAFTLEQEDGNWKIRGIQVKDQDTQPGAADTFHQDDLWNTVNQQLEAFKKGELEQAYQQFTSQGFQQETSYKDFSDFIKEHQIFADYKKAMLENLTFNNNIGILTVGLEGASGIKQAADFSLVHEDEQWKVLQIQLYEPVGH